jgi:regulator of replication initiation timing
MQETFNEVKERLRDKIRICCQEKNELRLELDKVEENLFRETMSANIYNSRLHTIIGELQAKIAELEAENNTYIMVVNE